MTAHHTNASLLSSRAKRGICILLFATTSHLIRAQLTLPSGWRWRKPTTAEAAGEWRRKSPTRFLVVKADFDGDGQKDVAELLIEEKGKRCGLFVRLSGEHSGWQSLRQFQGLFDLGIRVVRPGKYETLCVSDPSVCEPETAKELDLKTSAIEFFSYGTTSTYFYWDRKTKKFRSAPMSD